MNERNSYDKGVELVNKVSERVQLNRNVDAQRTCRESRYGWLECGKVSVLQDSITADGEGEHINAMSCMRGKV